MNFNRCRVHGRKSPDGFTGKKASNVVLTNFRFLIHFDIFRVLLYYLFCLGFISDWWRRWRRVWPNLIIYYKRIFKLPKVKWKIVSSAKFIR